MNLEGQDYPADCQAESTACGPISINFGGFASAPHSGGGWKPDPQHSFPVKAPKKLWDIIQSYADWYNPEIGGGMNKEEADNALLKFLIDLHEKNR